MSWAFGKGNWNLRCYDCYEWWCLHQSMQDRIKIRTRWRDLYQMILNLRFGKHSWQILLEVQIYSLRGIKYSHLPSKIFKESWHHCLNSCFSRTRTFKIITHTHKKIEITSFFFFLTYISDIFSLVRWFPMSNLIKTPARDNYLQTKARD